MNIPLPSPGYLFGLIVFGLVGWVAFRRGRKAGKPSLVWLGLATMVFPYVVPQTWLLWLVGAAATGWIAFEWS